VGSVLFRNIGTLISGDIHKPLSDASSVYIEDGIIKGIRSEQAAETVIDVRGATLAPGFWDAHHHPYFGEYTPRAEAFNTMTKTVRAGTTAVVSAGPAHQPGIYLPSETIPNVQAHFHRQGISPDLARDAVGTKALAIVTAKAWHNDRPMGIKCYAETVIAESGLTADDFVEMAEAGVLRIKFLRPIPFMREAEKYCQWAHDNGMLTMTHTGGRKLIKETQSISESLHVLRPDVACHVNGGPTPPPMEDVDWLIQETGCTLDLVLNGNMNVARHVLQSLRERGELHRVVIGTDSPSNSGVNPGGVLRMVTLLCNLSGLPPEQLICMATGNTARNFRLPGGLVETGQPADLVVWDSVDGSVTGEMLECIAYGDKPAAGMIMIDGEIKLHGDPRSIDARRMPTVTRC
jgi:enamidase